MELRRLMEVLQRINVRLFLPLTFLWLMDYCLELLNDPEVEAVYNPVCRTNRFLTTVSNLSFL